MFLFDFARDYFKAKQLKKIKASPTPWIEIRSEKIDAAKGEIKLTLDWNDAFIKGLRNAGYRGINDDELIDHYLYSVFKSSELNYTYADQIKEEDKSFK